MKLVLVTISFALAFAPLAGCSRSKDATPSSGPTASTKGVQPVPGNSPGDTPPNASKDKVASYLPAEVPVPGTAGAPQAASNTPLSASNTPPADSGAPKADSNVPPTANQNHPEPPSNELSKSEESTAMPRPGTGGSDHSTPAREPGQTSGSLQQ